MIRLNTRLRIIEYFLNQFVSMRRIYKILTCMGNSLLTHFCPSYYNESALVYHTLGKS